MSLLPPPPPTPQLQPMQNEVSQVTQGARRRKRNRKRKRERRKNTAQGREGKCDFRRRERNSQTLKLTGCFVSNGFKITCVHLQLAQDVQLLCGKKREKGQNKSTV